MARLMPDPNRDGDALILALDTASNNASVAVLRGDQPLLDHRWTIDSTPSEELLAAIDTAIERVQVERDDLDGVVVITGPGGYGGLRVGVATAQGLAFGLGIPLAGVGRLDAEAAAHFDASDGRPVVAVHDAGRSGIAWAAFEATVGGDASAVVAPRLDEPEVVSRDAPRDARWCGELSERIREVLAAAGRDAELQSGDTTSAVVEPPSRAASAVRLARVRSAFGDPAGVDVVYLRPPSITRPRA